MASPYDGLREKVKFISLDAESRIIKRGSLRGIDLPNGLVIATHEISGKTLAQYAELFGAPKFTVKGQWTWQPILDEDAALIVDFDPKH